MEQSKYWWMCWLKRVDRGDSSGDVWMWWGWKIGRSKIEDAGYFENNQPSSQIHPEEQPHSRPRPMVQYTMFKRWSPMYNVVNQAGHCLQLKLNFTLGKLSLQCIHSSRGWAPNYQTGRSSQERNLTSVLQFFGIPARFSSLGILIGQSCVGFP